MSRTGPISGSSSPRWANAGAYPAASRSALRSRSGTSRCSASRSTISLLGRERPVSMKLRCRDETPASSARSICVSRRRPRHSRRSSPISGPDRDVAHDRTLPRDPPRAEQLRVRERRRRAGPAGRSRRCRSWSGRASRGRPSRCSRRPSRGCPTAIRRPADGGDARPRAQVPRVRAVDDAERADGEQERGRQAEQVAHRAVGDDVGQAAADARDRVDLERAAQQAVAGRGGGCGRRRRCGCSWVLLSGVGDGSMQRRLLHARAARR